MNPRNLTSLFVPQTAGDPKPSVFTAVQPQTYMVRGHQVTDKDLQTLRNVLFAEVSNRNPQKQALEANTILNTALNRMDQYKAQGQPKTLSDVVTAPNQYQGYNSKEYQRLLSGKITPVDHPKLNAIDTVLGQAKSGKLQDNTAGMVYYKHDSNGGIHLHDGSLFSQPRNVQNLTGAQLTSNLQ